jgi:hypothetical protein
MGFTLIINKNKAPNKEEEKSTRWEDSNPDREDRSQENKSSN